MNAVQRRVIALCRKGIISERKLLTNCANIARFAGGDIGLKIAMQRHRSNIKMYEKLIANLKQQKD